MNRILIIGALLLSLAGMGYLVYYQAGRVAGLQASVTSLTEAAERAADRAKADRQVLVARQAKIVVQARKLARAQQALSEALQRNKAWSDTDVPDDVQKALAAPVSGLPDPVPAGVDSVQHN